MLRGGYQFDPGLISLPIVLLASVPALYLPPQMESDGNNYKPILYLHCCPAQQHPSVPATDFPVSAFHSLSKVSTDPPLRQLCGPSPVLYEGRLVRAPAMSAELRDFQAAAAHIN